MNDQVLVLGGSGMLGYAIASTLEASGHRTIATIRASEWRGIFKPPVGLLTGIDALDEEVLAFAIGRTAPGLVINCVGMRQAVPSQDSSRMTAINGQLPHTLASLCRASGARFVHFSTDGVFDGQVGLYREGDPISPEGEYARSKAMGEILDRSDVLTIRTSMIGRSPTGEPNLVDWLLGTANTSITGFSGAVFSGLTVTEIANFIVSRVVRSDVVPGGLLHLAADPIDKLSLLRLLRREWGFDHETIKPSPDQCYDRSLVSVRRDILADYRPPGWQVMLREMRLFYETQRARK